MARTRLRGNRQARADKLLVLADKKFDQGDHSAALRLFLEAAKLGDSGAMLNIGVMYDTGQGTRPNSTKALQWYRRAYRRGVASAANNIGTVWRDAGELGRALRWFKRAVRMGDDSAHLEIAKIYLRSVSDTHKAIPHIEKVRASQWVSEADSEEAEKLFQKAQKRLRPRRNRPQRNWLQ